jgi:hypothetical protein
MLIIIDRKLPETVKHHLKHYGDLLELATKRITYEAISGHPDIFFTKTVDQLIVAPNLPGQYIQALENIGVKFTLGKSLVGKAYPSTAYYNAAISENYLIHNLKLTDEVVMKNFGAKKKMHVEQGYCRCNLIPLKDDHFVTSDKGIHHILLDQGLMSFYVNPEGIILTGFAYGFIGGTSGMIQDKIFFTGTLDSIPGGRGIQNILSELGYEVIVLNDGQLIDGGSILFIE